MSEQSLPWHHPRHFLINFPRDAQLKGEWAQSECQRDLEGDGDFDGSK